MDAGGTDDVGEVARSGVLLERFVADVEEAIRQVFTAGLSYPDPELGDELTALADRAERHGLPTAVRALMALEAWVRTIADEKDDRQRNRLAAGAWQETLALSSWVRLFKIELDFLTVEGALRVDVGTTEKEEEAKVPTRSATVWPVGFELTGSKLLIFCVDKDSGDLVVLRDHLSEIPTDLLTTPVISRLFQDQITLSEVVDSLVVLEDHPAVQSKDALIFRPAFRAIPKRLAVTEDFKRPELDPFDPTHPSEEPTTTQVTIRAHGDQLRWDSPASMHVTPLSRLNFTKLLMRDQVDRVSMELVVRPSDEGLRLLAAHTENDGRVFPAIDPALFRLAPEVLARSATDTATALENQGATGVYLKAAAFLFGGADDDAVERLRNDLESVTPQGLDQAYHAALARALVGEKTAADSVEPLVRDVLTLAFLPADANVPLDALGRVLGHSASPADMRAITEEDGLLYRALWLINEADLLATLGEEVRKLVAERYSDKLDSVTAETVCARALATFLVWKFDNTASGDDDDDEGPTDVLVFFEAHLADLGASKRRRRRKQQMPMPDLLELFQLADTWTTLRGGGRHEVSLAGLPLVPIELAQTCASALRAWRADGEVDAAQRAGDALLVVAAAGLRPFLVTP